MALISNMKPQLLIALPLFLAFGLIPSASANPNAYPYDPLGFRVPYTDSSKITAADWVGPDGIVYPKLTSVGANVNTAGWAVINVNDGSFGNPVDGDITAELRTAIWNAGMNHNGAIVRIAPGTFKLSEPVVQRFDNVVIEGTASSGANKTTLQMILATKVSHWPKVKSGSNWNWAPNLSGGAWDVNRNPTPVGAPHIYVNYFNNKVTRWSDMIIVADPVYRWITHGGNDASKGLAYHHGAINQIKTYRLKLYNTDKSAVVHTLTHNVNRGTASGETSHGWNNDSFYSFRQHVVNFQHMQAEVEYVDGTIVSGPVQTFPAEYLMPFPAKINNRRGTGNISSWLSLMGDEWSERNTDFFLAAPAKRGDTTLQLANLGTIQAGDQIAIQSNWVSGWKNVPSNIPKPVRSQFFRVTSVNPATNTLHLDVPLRYDEAGTANSFVRRRHPLRNGGIRKLHLQQIAHPGSLRHWFSAIGTSAHVTNSFFDDLVIEGIGRNGIWIGSCKNVTISNSKLLWSYYPSTGSASGYFGFGGSYDMLIDNVAVIGHRHGPNIHGGNGVLVRNVYVDGGDTQLHMSYAQDVVWENVRARADSKGSYGSGFHPADFDSNIHGGGTGDRMVIFNSDLSSRNHGVDLAGGQEGVVIAYSRLRSESESPLKIYKGSFNHIIYGNVLIGENPFTPALQFGSVDSGGATQNPGTHFIRNTIYGTNGQISAGAPNASSFSTLERSFANVMRPLDHEAPRPVVHPGFVSGSLYLTQLANPSGMTPTGVHYHPTQDNGVANESWNPGTVVAEINFNPSNQNTAVNNLQRGWLIEDRQIFGSRGNGFSYGWDNTSGINTASDANWSWSFQNIPELNLPHTTWSDFGSGSNRKWSIELPAGTYKVYLALGRPRDPRRGDYQHQYPLANGTIAVANRALKVNNKTFIDQDWQQSSGHPAEVWLPGVTNAGDATDAAWLENVVVADSGNGKGLLTLERVTDTDPDVKIRFLGIYLGDEGGGSANFIDFENYNLGALNGQDGWTALSAWNIVANPQGSGKSLRASPNIRYHGATRFFSPSELGGTLNTSQSLVAFQFDYRADSGVCGWQVQRFAIGGLYDFAPSFQPRAGGDNHWRYFDGTTDHIAKAANGTNFSFIGKGWVTIDGVIDYATKRFTLYVDGVQQMGGTSDGWLAFKNGSDPSKLDARFYSYVDNILNPIEIDNIAMTLVEPQNSNVIDFNNYNLGQLGTQDGWTSQSAWNIVADPQGSGKSLRANANIRYHGATRFFTPTELGGTLNTSSSKLAYQFDYRADSGVCGWQVQRFAIGGLYDFAPSFQPRAGGDNHWRYFDGTTDHIAKAANGTNFSFIGKGWVTIDGVINYATKRYTLYVDGVQQMGGTSDGWLAFKNGSDPSKLDARFYSYVDNILNPIEVDNIILELVP
jgi:hypothetical protein